jgi:hypothetical protein
VRKIILFIILFGIAGCGFVFQDLNQIQDRGLTLGMSKEEVIAKIGNPQKMSRVAIDNKEYEVWEYRDNDQPKTDKINVLGTNYSKIFFLDGKLNQSQKERIYAQPAYEYLELINPPETKAVKINEEKENLK